MIKQILIACITLTIFNSCASLYNTTTAPTPFLEQKDGVALQGGIGTNVSTNFASASITKAISKDVCLNLNGSIGFMGNYQSPNNPYKGSKKMNSLAVNYGWNTRRITKYPIQIWVGLQSGVGNDSYFLPYWLDSKTKDVTVLTTDTAGNPITKFEKAQGSFIGGRIGLTHVLLSNYENDEAKKNSKRTKFDIIGTLNYNPIKYTYKNTANNLIENNALIGYNAAIRVYQNRWILTLNLDNNASAKYLKDQITNTKNPRPIFDAIPMSIPTISYTMLLGKQKK
jgi:hypothetical protein